MRSLNLFGGAAALAVFCGLIVSVAGAGGGEAAPTSVSILSRAGLGRYRPGRWGIVRIEAINRTERPVEVVGTAHFSTEPHRQYARRLWLPPRSHRRSWCPVKLPQVPRGYGAVRMVSLTVEQQGGMEVLRADSWGERQPSGLLLVDHVRGIAAVVGRRGSTGGASDWEISREVSDGILAFNEAAGLPLMILSLGGEFLAPTPEALDGLDLLVLAGDQLASDVAALRAVRQWLLEGGRLWVMLDQVDLGTVELLLGDAFDGHVVDRVGLTSVRLQSADPEFGRSDGEAREYDEPVEMVRIVSSAARPVYRVNGWPAALIQTVGQGRVLLTTLGPRGWLRPRVRTDPQPTEGPYYMRWIASDPMTDLAYLLVRRPTRTPTLAPGDLGPFVSEQVGYRIVGREVIALVLGGFCVVLAGLGVLFRLRGRVERLIWVAPAVALSAAVVLAWLGVRSKRAVPPTVAVAQVVYMERGLDEAHATGLMALYNQTVHRRPLGARRGGIFDLDMRGGETQTRRMVWTDLGVWHWENLALPPGIRTASFDHELQVDGRVEVRAAFGPEGLRGQLMAGPWEGVSDAVLVLPDGGRLAARFGEGGRFTAGPEEVLAPGQFVAASWLDDRQRRRQMVYQRLLGGVPPMRPGRPLFLFWADPLDMAFTLPEGAMRRGSALVVLPLSLEPTPPGTPVLIPSACVGIRCVAGPDSRPSPVYNNHTGEWLPSRTPSEVWLRFQMPPQALPLALEEARLTVRIDAPTRRVEVLGWNGEQTVSLAERTGPVGSFTVTIDQPAALGLDDRGGLILGIVVGDEVFTEPSLGMSEPGRSSWEIQGVALEAKGHTGGASTAAVDRRRL